MSVTEPPTHVLEHQWHFFLEWSLSVQVVFTKLAESSWRTLLFWIGPPGLVIAGLSLLTLAEPRSSNANAVTSLVNAFKPKQKPRIAAEDMVTATQYSRVWPPQPCMPPACACFSPSKEAAHSAKLSIHFESSSSCARHRAGSSLVIFAHCMPLRSLHVFQQMDKWLSTEDDLPSWAHVTFALQSLTPAEVRAEKRALALQKAEAEEKRKSDLWASVRRLLKSPSFQVWAVSPSLSVFRSWLNAP